MTLQALWAAHRERRLPSPAVEDPRQLALHAELAGEDSAVAGLFVTVLRGERPVSLQVTIGRDETQTEFGRAVEAYRETLRAMLIAAVEADQGRGRIFHP